MAEKTDYDRSIMERLGRRIKKLRERKGLTQRELAERSDYQNRSYIANVERGSQNPSLKSISRIASALGITLGELFSNIEKESDGQKKEPEHLEKWWNELIDGDNFGLTFTRDVRLERLEFDDEDWSKEPSALTDEKLAERRQQNNLYLEIVSRYLDFITTALDNKPHILAVSDQDGWILELKTKGAFLNELNIGGRNLPLTAGLNSREIYSGKNGLNRALELECPVLIYSCQHSQLKYSRLTAFGLPFKLKQSGLQGALTFYTYSEDFEFTDMFLIMLAVKNIENLLEAASF